MKSGRLVVIEGAGHASYKDKPKVFHKELLNFLRSLDKKGDGKK